MNGLILILSFISLGYIYQTKNQVTRFTITKMPAHHIYYKSAIIGLIFFILGWLCVLSIFLYSNFEYDENKKILENFIDNIQNLPDFKIIWILSFFVSLVFCMLIIWLKNRYLLWGLDKNKDINEIYSLTLTDPLDKLLNDSAFLSDENFLDKIIMLTMSDKKIYVGTILPDSEIFHRFSYGSQEFTFCPIYSGYRNKDTLEVIITTDYLKDISEYNKKFDVILSKNNIISATKVDLDTFLRFTEKDVILKQLKEISVKRHPVLISLKSKNIYIGYIDDSILRNSSVKDIDFITLNLKFHMISEKDKINLKQYYDYSINIENLYINISFKEIETIMYRTNPEKIWIDGERIDTEMLKNMFNYKLIEINKDGVC